MIKIRHNIFETNSSSTHAMCIYRDDKDMAYPASSYIEFRPGRFGWAFSKLEEIKDKASYLYTSLLHVYSEEESQEIIRAALEPEGIVCIFMPPFPDEFGDKTWYIDHGAESNFVQRMKDDPHALRQFLFNPNSYVITGNDNCDEDEYNWYKEQTRLDDEVYEVYERWN